MAGSIRFRGQTEQRGRETLEQQLTGPSNDKVVEQINNIRKMRIKESSGDDGTDRREFKYIVEKPEPTAIQ